MYTYTWYQWIAFFYCYCFFGWIFESTYVSIRTRHFVNRGFLRLPLLPLYGTGAVMMLWVSLPVQDHIVLVYLSGFFAATALEYVTGYTMERLFKMKYWDYSDQKFNINGYICLSSSIAWGFLTILLTEVIHKPIAAMVTSIPALWNIAGVAIISVFFIEDTVQSVRTALELGKVLENLTKMRAELDDIQVQLALLRAEASQKMDEYREDTAGRMEQMRSDAMQWLADHRQETVQKMDQLADLKNTKIDSLLERRQALSLKYQSFTDQLSHRRRTLLQRNPTAASRQFGRALKELYDAIEKQKK